MDKKYIAETVYQDAIKYKHNLATEYGCKRFVEEAINAKSELTALLEKMPGYNGNMQVVFEEDFDRDVDITQISNLVYRLMGSVKYTDIVKNVDADGKTFQDHLSMVSMPKRIKVEATDDEYKPLALSTQFDEMGMYKPSLKRWNNWSDLQYKLQNFSQPVLDDRLINWCNDEMPELKVNSGMKTSRFVTRVFEKFDVIRPKLQTITERTPNEVRFLKDFAAYSDAINPLSYKRKVVISTNPIDFLRMSFGNTWCSCHNIDQTNVRNSFGQYTSGARAAGCVSYALDSTTFIMYVVPMDADNEHPEDTDKIYRNLFHYQDGNLIQSRVYPQCKDGATDLFKKLRNIMQKKLCEAYNMEFVNNGGSSDSWKLHGASYSHNGSYNNGDYHIQYESGPGSHQYPDFVYSYSGPVSTLKNFTHTNNSPIVIGHENICLCCGKYESATEAMSHDKLTHYRCHFYEEPTEEESTEEMDIPFPFN